MGFVTIMDNTLPCYCHTTYSIYSKWYILNKKIKLVMNESYYYFDTYNSISPFTKSLCLKLVDESGGEIICLEKR